MPVILDRLPLPNITWYTAASVLCLLCSVYYAGVQVKKNPNWKEELLQQQAWTSDVQASGTQKLQYGISDVGPLHWGVFNSSDQDEEGFCPAYERIFSEKFEMPSEAFRVEQRVCFKEDFEDILRATFYDDMCYIRYHSLDLAFSNFINYNIARRAQGRSAYSVNEYSRRCQLAARKLSIKYNTATATRPINLKLKNLDKHMFLEAEHDKIKTEDGSLYFNFNNDRRSIKWKGTPTNRCHDDQLRNALNEVSVYHDVPCDGNERELSPYLIPEIISFIFHEPLCIWTLINMAYCVLILLGTAIQRMVFGELRVSEQQHIKDKFWNFVFYKFIFVFGVMNVKHMDEAVLWCSWFSVLGFLHLLAQLCKDRFEYLSFSGHTGRRTHIRLLCLLGIILLVASACLVISVLVGCHAGINTFAFMAAECTLLIVRTLYVITRYSIYLWDITHQGLWEKRGGYVYITELLFELSELVIDMVHHIHMLVWGNIMLTMASLVICMQLRLLFYQLQHKVKTHRNFLRVRKLLARYPEVENQQQPDQEEVTCAICWDAVIKGRRLPCYHVFHTDCLLAWLPQHLSCPTCRHKLKSVSSTSQGGIGLGFFSRIFSRRSSDPLEAGAGAEAAPSSSSQQQLRISSSSPRHAPATAAVLTSGDVVSAAPSLAPELETGEFADAVCSVTANVSDPEMSAYAAAADVYDDDVTTEKGSVSDDEDDMERSTHSDSSSGFGGVTNSLLDPDHAFWGGAGRGHLRRRVRGSASGSGEGGRYVSWLSSFSVEQRHTQFRPQLPSAESSLHSMTLQVQQMFPHMNYDTLLEDLRRTRSIVSTVDNIIEDRLPQEPIFPLLSPAAPVRLPVPHRTAALKLPQKTKGTFSACKDLINDELCKQQLEKTKLPPMQSEDDRPTSSNSDEIILLQNDHSKPSGPMSNLSSQAFEGLEASSDPVLYQRHESAPDEVPCGHSSISAKSTRLQDI